MSRFAQVLARLSPVGLVVPAMIYVSRADLAHGRQGSRARPIQEPIVESAEKGRPAPRTSAPEAEPAQKPASVRPRPEPAPAQKSEEPPAPNATADVQGHRGQADRLGHRAGVLRHRPRPHRSGQPHRLRLGPRAAPGARPRAGDGAEAHQVPTIERPFAIRVPFFQITLLRAGRGPQAAFHHPGDRRARARGVPGAGARAGRRQRAFKDQALIVFVHGYNTDFDYALYRTAQMAYDLQVRRRVVPLQLAVGGGLTGYGYDRESATQAEPLPARFHRLSSSRRPAPRASASSRTAWATCRCSSAARSGAVAAGRTCSSTRSSWPPPTSTATCSPIWPPTSSKYGRGITLYCSANDRAMAAARRVAGGVPRAGDVPADGPDRDRRHRHHRRQRRPAPTCWRSTIPSTRRRARC